MRRALRPGSSVANVAELVDALDLGSSGVTRESSSLSFRTKPKQIAISVATPVQIFFPIGVNSAELVRRWLLGAD